MVLTFTYLAAVELFYELIASQLQGIVHLCTARSGPRPRHLRIGPYKMFERGGIVELTEHH